jgi:hypothetical protein
VRRRTLPTLLAVGAAAIIGVAAGVLISAPWAGGQGEPRCAPVQTVPEQALAKLARLNKRISDLIEDEPKVRLGDFYGRVAELRGLKHDLIREHFAPLFGRRPLPIIKEVEGIDAELEVAKEFKAREGADARGPLRIARQHKEALERLLANSPCPGE